MPATTAAKLPPINPYLTVKGADEAIALYQKAFGAKQKERMAAEDGKRVMHAALAINGGTVMLCDEFPEYGGPGAPSTEHPASVAVTIQYKRPTQVDQTYETAVAAGCKSVQQPQDMFWHARFAMLTDPFGHRWMLSAPLPKEKKKAPPKKKKKK
ncbi:MAG TPA: VOC family protein [Hyphomicrobiaceae bacterium]|nr:VOC family protein [Hyphomicrobiaceae bacterium]